MAGKLSLKLVLIVSLFFALLTGCDQLTSSNDEPETLYVKFINDSTSTHTITTIQLMAMGKVDDEQAVKDSTWSADILDKNETIAPGEHRFFTLEIPNLHYSIYRLGVDDGKGNEIFLDEQPGYTEDNVFVFTPTITHWGSDKRTVEVRLNYYAEKNLIYIAGYSDNAGIE